MIEIKEQLDKKTKTSGNFFSMKKNKEKFIQNLNNIGVNKKLILKNDED